MVGSQIPSTLQTATSNQTSCVITKWESLKLLPEFGHASSPCFPQSPDFLLIHDYYLALFSSSLTSLVHHTPSSVFHYSFPDTWPWLPHGTCASPYYMPCLQEKAHVQLKHHCRGRASHCVAGQCLVLRKRFPCIEEKSLKQLALVLIHKMLVG